MRTTVSHSNIHFRIHLKDNGDALSPAGNLIRVCGVGVLALCVLSTSISVCPRVELCVAKTLYLISKYRIQKRRALCLRIRYCVWLTNPNITIRDVRHTKYADCAYKTIPERLFNNVQNDYKKFCCTKQISMVFDRWGASVSRQHHTGRRATIIIARDPCASSLGNHSKVSGPDTPSGQFGPYDQVHREDHLVHPDIDRWSPQRATAITKGSANGTNGLSDSRYDNVQWPAQACSSRCAQVKSADPGIGIQAHHYIAGSNWRCRNKHWQKQSASHKIIAASPSIIVHHIMNTSFEGDRVFTRTNEYSRIDVCSWLHLKQFDYANLTARTYTTTCMLCPKFQPHKPNASRVQGQAGNQLIKAKMPLS